MITLIVPTFNRAHTLALTLPSLFAQNKVNELIFVIDGSTDDTAGMIAAAAQHYPDKIIRTIRNSARLGAGQCRNLGAAAAINDIILFCDDDELMEQNYAAICLEILMRRNAGAVAGRQIYLREGETPHHALQRFGNGTRNVRPFRPLICEHVSSARFEGEIKLPFTHSIILTRKQLLLRFPFDSHYNHGNGYREETDFQMNLFLNDHDVYVTNACHIFHLPPSQVRSGGQSSSPFVAIYWSVIYTHYFFEKYFDRYAGKIGLTSPKSVALAAFTGFISYRLLVKPWLRRAYIFFKNFAAL